MPNNYDQSSTGWNVEAHLFYDTDAAAFEYAENFVTVERGRTGSTSKIYYIDCGNVPGPEDIKVFVKFFYTDKTFNNIIHKYRRNFMSIRRMNFDTTNRVKFFCVSKRNSGYSRTMPAWVYSDNKLPLVIVVIKLCIKFLHHIHGFGIVHIRIQHLKSFRKFTTIFQFPVKVNYTLRKFFLSAHLTKIDITLITPFH